MWTLTARWIFPVASPPLRDGTVTIEGERIVAVAPSGERRADVDLGNVAVLPGLVNAHTHLDLSGARGLTPPEEDFTAWLRAVIRHRRGLTCAQIEADVRVGLAESLTHGTTLLGDISGDGSSWQALAETPLRAVVFRELLGLTRERADAALAAGDEWLRSHPATPTCRPGISPHAPYSVRADLIARAAVLATRYQAPLAIHLAESAAEIELLRHRRGPFVAFLQELGVWDPDGLAESPAQVLNAAAGNVPRLFIHGNYLGGDATLDDSAAIVYCPRTHAAFGHPPHPFRAFLARGKRVALGTDSLASNPDLDVLGEARFLHQHYSDVPGKVLLHMATLAGAEALGWADEAGSLTPGKSADLVVVPLPPHADDEPHSLILGSAASVQAVLCRGRWVHGADKVAAEIPAVS